MSGALLATSLARWLDLIGQAGVLGSVSFELLVLPAGARRLDPVRRSLRGIGLAALVLLTVASVAELVARASTMAGGGLAAGLSALPLVVEKTHFGAIWGVRALAIGVLALLCTATSRRTRMISFVAALATAATTALTGHAAGGGDLTPIAFVDWVHIVASGGWTGGLFCLSFAVLRNADVMKDTPLLAQIAGRFSRLAGACVVAVLVTGIANVWVQFADIAALWSTPYGRIFTGKLACVVGLLGIGAVNRYVVVPGFSREPSRAGTQHADRVAAGGFTRYVAVEVILAALVFGCTAFLGQLPPPRHGTMHGNGEHASVEGIAGPLRTGTRT